MKITHHGPTPATTAAAPVAAPASLAPAGAAPANAGAPSDGALLRTARAQLAQMPEIDLAQVAQLRGALERGEIAFDAGRLASLIARYHGSRG